MSPIGKLNKWLLIGLFLLVGTVVSLFLLIVFFGRDSVFLQNNTLAIIPITFQILMCASFITYLLERTKKKHTQVTYREVV
jgi:uncharacterized membrane protein